MNIPGRTYQLTRELQDWEAYEMDSLWRKTLEQTQAKKLLNLLYNSHKKTVWSKKIRLRNPGGLFTGYCPQRNGQNSSKTRIDVANWVLRQPNSAENFGWERFQHPEQATLKPGQIEVSAPNLILWFVKNNELEGCRMNRIFTIDW